MGRKNRINKINLPTIPEWDILYNPVETTENVHFVEKHTKKTKYTTTNSCKKQMCLEYQ